MKTKKKLNESTPGYDNRQFGAPLPTLSSIQKEFQARQAAKNVKALKEEYIENMYDLDDGLELIKDAWMGWKNGIATQASDIKPAQKELLNYVNKWLKKNIK